MERVEGVEKAGVGVLGGQAVQEAAQRGRPGGGPGGCLGMAPRAACQGGVRREWGAAQERVPVGGAMGGRGPGGPMSGLGPGAPIGGLGLGGPQGGWKNWWRGPWYILDQACSALDSEVRAHCTWPVYENNFYKSILKIK